MYNSFFKISFPLAELWKISSADVGGFVNQGKRHSKGQPNEVEYYVHVNPSGLFLLTNIAPLLIFKVKFVRKAHNCAICKCYSKSSTGGTMVKDYR